MKVRALLLILSPSLLWLSGCQTMPYQPYARSVKVQPSKGGVVAMHLTHREEDRVAAQGIMKNTCGPHEIQVLEEGEVVIGTVTTSDSTQRKEEAVSVGSLFGIPVTSGEDGKRTTSQSSTEQKKEWQISYKCQSVASRGGRSNTRIR